MKSKIKIQKIENYMTGCLSVFTECCTIPKESLLMVHEMFSAICKSNLTQARPTPLSILKTRTTQPIKEKLIKNTILKSVQLTDIKTRIKTFIKATRQRNKN